VISSHPPLAQDSGYAIRWDDCLSPQVVAARTSPLPGFQRILRRPLLQRERDSTANTPEMICDLLPLNPSLPFSVVSQILAPSRKSRSEFPFDTIPRCPNAPHLWTCGSTHIQRVLPSFLKCIEPLVPAPRRGFASLLFFFFSSPGPVFWMLRKSALHSSKFTPGLKCRCLLELLRTQNHAATCWNSRFFPSYFAISPGGPQCTPRPRSWAGAF